MEDRNLISLIHDITQLGYYVQFCDDFEGMVRLEFTEEYSNEFYQHYHLGIPGGSMDKLEKEVIESLSEFLKEKKEEANAKT